MRISQEENIVRVFRQMIEQGFDSFVILENNVLSIFGKNVQGQMVTLPHLTFDTLAPVLLRHKPPYSITKIIADIEHDYVGPHKGYKWFDCVHKPNKLKYRESKAGELIFTLNGVVHCNEGDKIIIGVNNEQYPCDKDIFKLLYDEVDNASN